MSARMVKPEEGLGEAAEILRGGGIVAFPTETVYGLGANALDVAAVAKIYAAKGRPASNPIIVHVPDVAAARELAAEWPESAERLAAQFWPGPLTLVVPKAAHIPDIVTAGGPTVGIRIPSHPVALELLRRAAVPVAAPSANRSEEVSPTTAQHVADSLGAFVENLLILDGGPCSVGIESTVVDVTGEIPRVLRPGIVHIGQTTGSRQQPIETGGISRSPGQRTRHYAPSVPVILCPEPASFSWKALFASLFTFDKASENGRPVGLLSLYHGRGWGIDAPIRVWSGKSLLIIPMPNEPEGYAALLYAALRNVEAAGVKRIMIEEPPDAPEWAAIHDRLRRAAAKKDNE